MTPLIGVCLFLSLVVIGPSLSILLIMSYVYHTVSGTLLFLPRQRYTLLRVFVLVLLLNLPYQLALLLHSYIPLNLWIGQFIGFLLHSLITQILG